MQTPAVPQNEYFLETAYAMPPIAPTDVSAEVTVGKLFAKILNFS